MDTMKSPGADIDFARVINITRLELETAGNPAYMVVIVDAAGEPHLAPMVFSTVGPAADHAQRLTPSLGAGEQVVLVSRSAVDQRAMFTVLEPRTLRKLFQRPEVVEQSLSDAGGSV